MSKNKEQPTNSPTTFSTQELIAQGYSPQYARQHPANHLNYRMPSAEKIPAEPSDRALHDGLALANAALGVMAEATDTKSPDAVDMDKTRINIRGELMLPDEANAVLTNRADHVPGNK